MRIAVDLDGVIFDTEKDFRILSELYDTDNFKENNIVTHSASKFYEIYNWDKKQCVEFYSNNVFNIEENSNIMPIIYNIC